VSGFFGMLASRGERVDENLLHRAAAALSFRGPDGSNIWNWEEFGAAFTLLRTGPGQQAAHQPVVLDGRYHLLGDVRIDAQKELSASLQEAGDEHQEFGSSEDLLLRAWRGWGAGCLEKIIGDFSFALWDSTEKTLWCARDFIGPRPFFYAQSGGQFYFSNTLQVLCGVPDLSLELDEIYIGDFLREGFCKDPARTVYQKIHRLAPGHLLSFCNGGLKIRRFLKIPFEEPLYLADPNEYLEMFRELLREAVRDRLPRGKAGLYLSGGLDSSTVCAMASRVSLERRQGDREDTEQLKGFTISWRELFADAEPEYAARTAKYLKLSHEVLQDPLPVPQGNGSLTLLHTVEPSGEIFWATAVGNYRRMAQHARVILGGDGGDDILTGQSWPFLQTLWNKKELSRMVQLYGKYILRHGKFPPLRGGFRGKIKSLWRGEAGSKDSPRWINPDFEKRQQLQQQTPREKEISAGESHPLHPLAFATLQNGYWGDVLEREDAGSTGVLLQPRAPMLDLRVLRFELRLPAVPWCMDKYLTRKAMRGFLPEQVLARAKTPLLQDPLETILARNNWRPNLTFEPPASLGKYVLTAKWRETLESSQGSIRVDNLRPLFLAYWLKDIENSQSIQ
jgi:asparagine synthase (glutamine-hydrolysing)